MAEDISQRPSSRCFPSVTARMLGVLIVFGAAVLLVCSVPVLMSHHSFFRPVGSEPTASYELPGEKLATNEASAEVHRQEAPSGTNSTCSLNSVLDALCAYRRGQRGDGFDQCPDTPPFLVGDIKTYMCGASLTQLESLDFRLDVGGHYRPKHCLPRNRAAVIIPFRNRWNHLPEFLLNMHPFLQKQDLEYTIYIINQVDNETFNRGLLLNIGAVASSRLGSHECFIFHDVDLIPLNDKNLYGCPHNFHHYAAGIDKFKYGLPYSSYVGGVLSAKKYAFEKVNGFSSLFFGWGGEDDDMAERITYHGFTYERYDRELTKYKMIKHELDKGNEVNPERFTLLRDSKARSDYEGLNTTLFTVVGVTHSRLFTLINVTVNRNLIFNSFYQSGYTSIT